MIARKHSATHLCVALAMAAAGLTAVDNTLAQSYPNRPVRVITNYTPGGTTDYVARTMAAKLSEAVSQPVVVENKPSANGVIGTQEVIRSKPDGYTLLFSSSGHTSVSKALLMDKLPFDPFKEIAPISLLVMIKQVLVVPPSLGVKNIPELVKLMKANPGKYSYGSTGTGGPGHLAIELLKHLAGFEMVHVPYKGGTQAVADLAAGRTQLMQNGPVTILGLMKSGKLIPIGVGSRTRASILPDTPTVAEQGYPDYESFTWFAMFGPAALPRDILMKLNGIYNDALKAPDVITGFEKSGAEPAGGTPDDLTRIMRSEYERWRKVVVVAKIEVN